LKAIHLSVGALTAFESVSQDKRTWQHLWRWLSTKLGRPVRENDLDVGRCNTCAKVRCSCPSSSSPAPSPLRQQAYQAGGTTIHLATHKGTTCKVGG